MPWLVLKLWEATVWFDDSKDAMANVLSVNNEKKKCRVTCDGWDGDCFMLRGHHGVLVLQDRHGVIVTHRGQF